MILEVDVVFEFLGDCVCGELCVMVDCGEYFVGESFGVGVLFAGGVFFGGGLFCGDC